MTEPLDPENFVPVPPPDVLMGPIGDEAIMNAEDRLRASGHLPPPRKTSDPTDQHREHEEWWGCAGKFVCVSCGQTYVREDGEWFIVPRDREADR